MTELEQFAAAVVSQLHHHGIPTDQPVTVASLLDKLVPYRHARVHLGLDINEDYEATVLRLIAEEEQLVRTEPIEAAEMAKATMSAKLPDLDVLQLLRGARVVVTPQTVNRLQDVLPAPVTPPSPWAPAAEPVEPASKSTPVESSAGDIIPPHTPDAANASSNGDDATAEEHLTTNPIAAPQATSCWSCGETLPGERVVKFCPFCGADQREPTCAGCGAAVERRWKHCPDCGLKLWVGAS